MSSHLPHYLPFLPFFFFFFFLTYYHCIPFLMSFTSTIHYVVLLISNKNLPLKKLLENRPVCRVARTELSWVQRPSIRQSR